MGEDSVARKVTLTKGFWMGETQVTQEQWEAVTGNNPSKFKGAKLPVENVNWNDCQEFIAKLNAQNAAPVDFKFSLPSEACWEYACRVGSTMAYYFGNDWKELEKYAWYSGHEDFEEWENSEEIKNKTYSKWGNTTHEVGLKPANRWGLRDMHGNVYEWCEDWYEKDYPTGDVVDPVGASSGSLRVLRGGSWVLYAESCRSANRISFTPEC